MTLPKSAKDWFADRPFDPMKDSQTASIEIEPEDLSLALSEHVYDDVDPELYAPIVRRAVSIIETQAVDLIEGAFERAIYEVVHESLRSR